MDLAIETGSVFALLGPNGAGKTTMVRILATLMRPDAGTATIAGHDLLTEPVGVKRSISLTGQYAAVDEKLTGRENLEMMAQLLRLSRRAARARAAELLAEFDLADAGDRRAAKYSGGMRRRLDLAISMIARPRCCSSTSRPPGWTRAAASSCGARSGGWPTRASRSC